MMHPRKSIYALSGIFFRGRIFCCAKNRAIRGYGVYRAFGATHPLRGHSYPLRTRQSTSLPGKLAGVWRSQIPPYPPLRSKGVSNLPTPFFQNKELERIFCAELNKTVVVPAFKFSFIAFIACHVHSSCRKL